MDAHIGISTVNGELRGVLIDADVASLSPIESLTYRRTAPVRDTVDTVVSALRTRAKSVDMNVASVGLVSPGRSESDRWLQDRADRLDVVSVRNIKAIDAYLRAHRLLPEARHYVLLSAEETDYTVHLIEASVSLLLGMARVTRTGTVVDDADAEIRQLCEDNAIDGVEYIVASNMPASALPMLTELARASSSELITLDDEIDDHHAIGAALHAALCPRAGSAVRAVGMPRRLAFAWVAAVVALAAIGVTVALLGAASQRQSPPSPLRSPVTEDCVSYRVDSSSMSSSESDPDPTPPSTSVAPLIVDVPPQRGC